MFRGSYAHIGEFLSIFSGVLNKFNGVLNIYWNFFWFFWRFGRFSGFQNFKVKNPPIQNSGRNIEQSTGVLSFNTPDVKFLIRILRDVLSGNVRFNHGWKKIARRGFLNVKLCVFRTHSLCSLFWRIVNVYYIYFINFDCIFYSF